MISSRSGNGVAGFFLSKQHLKPSMDEACRRGWSWIERDSGERFAIFQQERTSRCRSTSKWWWNSIPGNGKPDPGKGIVMGPGSSGQTRVEGGTMIKGMKDFQIPLRVEADKDALSSIYGKFSAEAFERGFGTTIGNSLRRVLLSSLTGAAITTVRIEGVLHEFSTIPGVTEDVTSIILNVKGLRLASHTEKPKTIRLKKKGPGEAKGSDIIHDADITILTPNLHIATLDKDATLDMEMTVKHGRGYVPAERNKEEGLPIGVIAIDSIFSPIKRVNFHVENARVGRMTDYDKLTLEIWTDGTISPSDALSTAAGILRDHVDIFINPEARVEGRGELVGDEAQREINKNLFRSVNELELSVRAANCLKNANIKTIADLVQKSEAEMLKTKNFGKKSLNEIKEILTDMGLSLGVKLDAMASGGPKNE